MSSDGEQPALCYLNLLTDEELIVLIDFHAYYYQRWRLTGEDARVAVVYHGQVLCALLEECERRGKSAADLGEEFNRKQRMRRLWEQKPAHA